MRTFFLSVFLASLAGALSVAFAGGGAYEKYIKYIVSLLLILLLISPFASLKSIDYELEAQETLSIAANDGAVYEQQIHEELLLYFDALLQNDLGINARDIRIDIGFILSTTADDTTVPLRTNEYYADTFPCPAIFGIHRKSVLTVGMWWCA